MALPLWTILLVTIGLIWFFRMRNAQKEKLRRLGLKEIKGPGGIPILGNLLQMEVNGNNTTSKWADQYGPIFKMKIGSQK